MYGMFWKDYNYDGDYYDYDEFDEDYVYGMMGSGFCDSDDDDHGMSKEEFADYNDVSNYNPIFHAVHEGDSKRFKALLNLRFLDKNIRGRTLLHVAAARGHAKIVEILCVRKSLIETRDSFGHTALHLAIKENHPEVFNLLLKESNLNSKTYLNKTPLHFAATFNRIQFAEILLQHKVNVNQEDMFKNTPLLLALEGNHDQLAEILLENGALVDVTDKNGKTPLHLAAETKNIHLVEILLKKGARVNVEDEDKFMKPIDIAAKNNDIQMVHLFLKHGAKLDEFNEMCEEQDEILEVMTPLHFAAEHGNLEMMKLLMMNGYNTIYARNDHNETPLHSAVRKNHLEAAKYLIENGKIIQESEDNCLLDLCNEDDHIDMLKLLIDCGVKFQDTDDYNLLEESLDDGDLVIWKYLLTRTSIIDAKSYSKETKLHSAVRDGQLESVKKILNQEANQVKFNSFDIKLAIHIAVENENEEILKVLLAAGYSVQSCFSQASPLHIAATFNHTRLLEILLKAGADINIKSKFDVTPLDFAAAAGNSNVVKFLLEAGADPKISGKDVSLRYALNRKSNDWIVTPFMYENLLKITEMLLIGGVCKAMENEYYYDTILGYASSIRVSIEGKENVSNSKSEETNTKDGEFRPEILRCLLNYLKDDKIKESLDSMMSCSTSIVPGALDVILEYNCDESQQIEDYNFGENDKSTLLIIDSLLKIEDFDEFFFADIEDSNEYISTDVKKMVVARLVLLPSDKKLEMRKQLFCKVNNLQLWQSECQNQITCMQKTKIIDEFNVTFYNILTNSVEKVANHLRDDNLLKRLESSYEKFPAYAEFLKIRVKRGKERSNLVDTCVNIMLNLVEKNYKIQFSSIDALNIFQYLSVIDLRKLSVLFS